MGATILRHSVFNDFCGGETVIWVNFARYSVNNPHQATKNRYFTKKVADETVIRDKVNGITLISNLVRQAKYVYQN